MQQNSIRRINNKAKRAILLTDSSFKLAVMNCNIHCIKQFGDGGMIEIRNAKIEDADRLLEIYDHYVRNTAVNFEYETPSKEEFISRMENVMKKYPYFVVTKGGMIQGYAYAGAFVGRAAYGWSCETTIYLDKNAHGEGMGRRLYEALETALKEMGIVNLYARVTYPEKEDEYLTSNSHDFHKHLGYEKVGELHKCGYKFGRWYNSTIMEKIIGDHNEGQPEVKAYKDLPLSRIG